MNFLLRFWPKSLTLVSGNIWWKYRRCLDSGWVKVGQTYLTCLLIKSSLASRVFSTLIRPPCADITTPPDVSPPSQSVSLTVTFTFMPDWFLKDAAALGIAFYCETVGFSTMCVGDGCRHAWHLLWRLTGLLFCIVRWLRFPEFGTDLGLSILLGALDSAADLCALHSAFLRLPRECSACKHRV